MESTIGHQVVFSKEISKEDSDVVREFGRKGWEEVISMRDNGFLTRRKVMECLLGQMEVYTRVILQTT